MAARREDYGEQRGTIITVFLGTITFAGVVVVLFALCGGLSFYVLAGIGGVALLGYFHYLVWGRSLDMKVAGEREEEEIRSRMEADERMHEEDSWRGNS